MTDGGSEGPPGEHGRMREVDSNDRRSADVRMVEAERKMADAEALLEIASAQLSVAARNIANANAAEREYRRAVWHYTQLMKHRISNPLQTIIGMADTLRDMPDLERSRRLAMLEAIAQQARVLRDISLEPRALEDAEQVLRPEPMESVVRLHEESRDEPAPKRSPFTRFRRPDHGSRDN